MRHLLIIAFILPAVLLADATRTSRDALKPFNVLVGSWKGSGVPEGTADERQKGHWQETVHCEWKFQGNDVWLELRFENGKHFRSGNIRPKDDKYTLTLTDIDKKDRTFTGTLKDKTLTMENGDERLVMSLLHENRILYRLERKSGTLFNKLYQVGLTKIGVPFAEVGGDPRECIVSGGRGTMTVMHLGKTYYVCCSGCRDEFKANPEYYVKEWEKRRKN